MKEILKMTAKLNETDLKGRVTYNDEHGNVLTAAALCISKLMLMMSDDNKLNAKKLFETFSEKVINSINEN